MIRSSEQCLPNLSLRALPVIVCVLFASKRSVGVEASSATRGLAMTHVYQVFKVVHNPLGWNKGCDPFQVLREMFVVLFKNTHIRKFDTKQLPYPHIES